MQLQEYTPDVGMPTFDRTTTWAFGSAFLLASAVLYGNAEVSAYGYSLTNLLTSTAYSYSTLSINWAQIISVASIFAAYAGNNADISDFTNHQTSLGIVTAFLVALSALSSDFQTAVNGGTTGLVFTAVLSVGYLSMVEMREIQEMRGDE